MTDAVEGSPRVAADMLTDTGLVLALVQVYAADHKHLTECLLHRVDSRATAWARLVFSPSWQN